MTNVVQVTLPKKKIIIVGNFISKSNVIFKLPIIREHSR